MGSVFRSGDHRLAEASSVSLHDPVDEPLILVDLPPSARHIMDLFHEQGLKPYVAHRTASFEFVRSLGACASGTASSCSGRGPTPATRHLTDRAKALIEYARTTISL
jgi:hypothetical protein